MSSNKQIEQLQRAYDQAFEDGMNAEREAILKLIREWTESRLYNDDTIDRQAFIEAIQENAKKHRSKR